MSICYDLRIKQVEMNLSNNTDIINWLLKMVNDKCITDDDIPNAIREYDRVHYLVDTTMGKQSIALAVDKNNNVYLDVYLSNKNKDGDMEALILMLAPHIKNGYIIMDNETYIEVVDIEKTLLNNEVTYMPYDDMIQTYCPSLVGASITNDEDDSCMYDLMSNAVSLPKDDKWIDANKWLVDIKL